MRISKIHIIGFRNFNDEEITFKDKTLVIGANDVGKTNLIYALRLLFDKSISERDLDLSDSDYNAYSGANQIEITVTIMDVVEECLLSTFGGSVKDGTLLIRYTNSKNGAYQLFVGFSEDTLTEITTRQYIRRLNMQCVDTNRDLFGFLKHERVQMLRLAKEKLSEAATLEDEQKAVEIQEKLDSKMHRLALCTTSPMLLTMLTKSWVSCLSIMKIRLCSSSLVKVMQENYLTI